MATEISQAKLDRLVKQGKSQAKCAEALGVTPGQLGMLRYGQALVNTGQLKKAPATAKSVKELRDKQSLRWEFIAAMTGLSVAKVRELYGNKDSYIGRGRKPGAGGGSSKSSSKPTGRKAGGRGGRQAAKPTRARTRAARAAKSGNPS
jgi:hypothetical protein